MKKLSSKIYFGFIMAFLYLPLIYLIAYSFNDGKTSVWKGFTFKWYVALFQDSQIMHSLYNSLLVALLASLFATFLGTLAAIGIYNCKGGYRTVVQTVSNVPIINPEIVTGVSMSLLFVFAIGLINKMGFDCTLNIVTLIIAHITFNIPYVVLSVFPKLKQMNKHSYEAALDLGCTPIKALFKVILPEIMSGVITGAIMAFTLSLDDFVISHFVSSPDFQTLPLYVYNQTAHNVKFSMYALSALIVIAILIILLVVNFAGSVGKKGGAK